VPNYTNGAQIIKPGDRVVTPCGRPAKVQGIDRYGLRVCKYTDREGGEANIAAKLLKLVSAAPVLPWPSYKP
jgi:hypothetical protein